MGVSCGVEACHGFKIEALLYSWAAALSQEGSLGMEPGFNTKSLLGLPAARSPPLSLCSAPMASMLSRSAALLSLCLGPRTAGREC